MVFSVLVNEAVPVNDSVPMVAETVVIPEFPDEVFPVMAILLTSSGNDVKAYATETTFDPVFPICKPELLLKYAPVFHVYVGVMVIPSIV